MAYQGVSPYLFANNLTNVQLLDDISGLFNGSVATFNLTIDGVAFRPEAARGLFIVLGGIVQDPDTDYTVSGSQITFTTAPASGLTFAGRNIYGLNAINNVNDGVITPAKLTTGGPSWDTSGNATITGNITQTGSTNNLIINTDTPTVRPTLDLNFERDQRLDSRITFSRNSTATYLGSDGLIKTALADQPRFEFDTSGNCLGLLIEESRTNFRSNSTQIETQRQILGTWTESLNTSETLAPDGSSTADKLTHSSGNIYRLNWSAGAADGSVSKTFSAYFKGVSGGETLSIDIGDTSHTNFTLTTNWQRLSVTTSSLGNGNFVDFSSLGNSFYVWGAQVEAGAFATSYIPTSGSTVTRAVDEATITGTNFTDWYNASEGSIFAKYSAGTNISESPFGFTKTGSESTDVIAIGASSSGPDIGVVPTLVVADGGVTQTGITIAINPVDGDIIKTAIAYKENDFAISSGIGTESGFASDSSGTIPTVDIARIGKYPYYGIWQNRPIARIMYYPKRLPNAQLQNLTK